MKTSLGLPQNESQQFLDWVPLFNARSAAIYGRHRKLVTKRTVNAILAGASKLAVARGTPAQLQANLLYACFRAESAVASGDCAAAEHRKTFEAEFALLKDHHDDVLRARNHLVGHRDMALKAMAHAETSRGSSRQLVDESAIARIDGLRSLLDLYEHGLAEICDFNHVSHISAMDFRCGPFEFDDDLYDDRQTRSDVYETGLMFHLAYLFRYFTSAAPPPSWVDIGGNILDVNGFMLSTGRPHNDLIAPLVNAVFATKMSASAVKDRLRDLNRFSKGSCKPSALPRPRKSILFVGWR
jgi:hypothetical protein